MDDSLFDIEAVQTVLPEVTTISYHRKDMYRYFSCFNLKEFPDYAELVKRKETYRTDKYRQQLKMRCGSYSDFILALEMKIDIHKALLSEVERLAELTQRTNKCTNGVRFTVKNIKDLMNKTDSYIYSVFLSDKYADLGLIGAIGVIDDNLMLFNVSCRALGREVENNLFQFIKEKHVIERIMFKATGKNEYLKILISEFFPRIRIEE